MHDVGLRGGAEDAHGDEGDGGAEDAEEGDALTRTKG